MCARLPWCLWVHCRIGSSENPRWKRLQLLGSSLPHRQLRKSAIRVRARVAGSLPHRQLRKLVFRICQVRFRVHCRIGSSEKCSSSAKAAVDRSLPHRQLRKQRCRIEISPRGSLPHRQLRKCSSITSSAWPCVHCRIGSSESLRVLTHTAHAPVHCRIGSSEKSVEIPLHFRLINCSLPHRQLRKSR